MYHLPRQASAGLGDQVSRSVVSIYIYLIDGLLESDADGRTTREGVFASGDVVTGARTVVEAVAFSKRVAVAIDDYISNSSS